MKRAVLYSIVVFLSWIFLAQCLLLQNRMGNQKVYKLFAQRNIPLSIHDTFIDGRKLHYAQSGADSLPTLVFIHGSPGGWINYMSFMQDTALRKKFRMASIDRPGFGGSDYGEALHIQKQAGLILPILKKLKGSRHLYVCGHSMGAPVVVQMAAEAPELFTAIVIVGGR